MVSLRDDPARPETDLSQEWDRQDSARGTGSPKLSNSHGFSGWLLTGNILFLQETVSAKEFTN